MWEDGNASDPAIVRGRMEVSATMRYGGDSSADTIIVGVLDGERLRAPTRRAEVVELLSSGEARGRSSRSRSTHAGGKRWLLVGLGKVEDLTPERARVVAAVARERARELGAGRSAGRSPATPARMIATALVEGTMLADYRFERHKSAPAR